MEIHERNILQYYIQFIPLSFISQEDKYIHYKH